MKFKTEVRPLNSIKLTETSVCLGVPSKVRIESFFPPKVREPTRTENAHMNNTNKTVKTRKRARAHTHTRSVIFGTPWTIAHQAPLSMEFSRQEYWSVLPFPTPGDLPDPGIEPSSPPSPAMAGGFFTTSPGKPQKANG